MKFLIIIPAHNEESTILYTLKSLENQTFQNFSVVVVNDGSTDKTPRILEEFLIQNSKRPQAQCDKFAVQNLEVSEHQPGAKVVRTFNAGLNSVSWENFDVICKFDADIIFPKNYLEEVNKVYEENPKAGMVSGLVRVKKIILDYSKAYDFSNSDRQWIFENLSSKDHVRGPIKSYRKACFEAIGGLRPILGWDNIDVMLAKMHGFEVITLKNIWVKHLRPTAFKYKKQKAEKLGEYFYNIGLNFPLALISAAKSAAKNGRISDFFVTMKSFLSQNSERRLSPDEVRYIRRLRWREMVQKIPFIS